MYFFLFVTRDEVKIRLVWLTSFDFESCSNESNTFIIIIILNTFSDQNVWHFNNLHLYVQLIRPDIWISFCNFYYNYYWTIKVLKCSTKLFSFKNWIQCISKILNNGMILILYVSCFQSYTLAYFKYVL